MGWWTEESKGEEVMIGDEPADIVGEMLDRLVATYRRDLHRKPSVREIEESLRFVLAAHLDELADGVEDVEVKAVAIKLGKLPKRQRVGLGDFFAVPLPAGGYGFGRVKRKCGGTGIAMLLVDFLDVHSTSVLSIPELLRRRPLLNLLCFSDAIMEWRWQVLGNVPFRGKARFGGPKDDMDDLAREGVTMYCPDSAAKLLEEALRERGLIQ
jgi:hypothetical protein